MFVLLVQHNCRIFGAWKRPQWYQKNTTQSNRHKQCAGLFLQRPKVGLLCMSTQTKSGAGAAAPTELKPTHGMAPFPGGYRRLGQSDLIVTTCTLGTMTWGEQNTEEEAHAQLDYAIHEAGINIIDCAENYPVPLNPETQGRTETYIGNWFKKNPGVRERIYVATKVCGPGRDISWIRGGPKLDYDSIIEACNGSLTRLQTDYIDLYQIHWPARPVPLFGSHAYPGPLSAADRNNITRSLEEQLRAMDALIRQGKIRYVGLSNETPVGIMEFTRIASTLGLPRVVSIQNSYSLLHRQFEGAHAEASTYCDVPLLAYSPLAGGALSGKYLPSSDPSQRERARFTLFKRYMQRYQTPTCMAAVERYTEIARKYKKTPSQLALSFVRSRWFTASTIIGATSMEQLRENLAAFDPKQDSGRWDHSMEDDMNNVYLSGYRDVSLGV
jgi:aryl-alcohol dehydrogenase-like predicted oxidoreductase